jgi:hypothetical protein
MTPEQFRDEMASILKADQERGADHEETHLAADHVMCELLRELGYGDGVDCYEQMKRWYA